MWTADRLRLETPRDLLEFDQHNAALVSFRAKSAPDQEFTVPDAALPAFTLQYLDDQRQFRQISSQQATHVSIELQPSASDRRSALVSARFEGLAGLDLC